MHYNPPEVTKIISLNKNYSSPYIFTFRKQQPESFFFNLFAIFLESSKKMSVIIDPTKTIEYFANIVDSVKAEQLHSLCIESSIRYLITLIPGHSNDYKCHCFSHLIFGFLIRILLSRKHH